LDGAFEVGQVFVDRGLQDRVRGIEVAVGEWSRMRAICRHGIEAA
jgi:hypothetical protein